MRTHLAAFNQAQVFLNYPFDAEFESFANAMHFAVVAAGLIPVCARDLSTPDRPRLEMLVNAIISCTYSAHDFSKCKGEGDRNFARLNMPIEMGMALFHALQTQRMVHNCAFFVATPHDYQIAASDLGGLDPIRYDDELSLVGGVYEWLRSIRAAYTSQPTVDVKQKYEVFKTKLAKIKGSEKHDRPGHDEAQELMFTICSDCKWWDWRGIRAGEAEFPLIPISWKDGNV